MWSIINKCNKMLIELYLKHFHWRATYVLWETGDTFILLLYNFEIVMFLQYELRFLLSGYGIM
jgi:hypothetical protein